MKTPEADLSSGNKQERSRSRKRFAKPLWVVGLTTGLTIANTGEAGAQHRVNTVMGEQGTLRMPPVKLGATLSDTIPVPKAPAGITFPESTKKATTTKFDFIGDPNLKRAALLADSLGLGDPPMEIMSFIASLKHNTAATEKEVFDSLSLYYGIARKNNWTLRKTFNEWFKAWNEHSQALQIYQQQYNAVKQKRPKWKRNKIEETIGTAPELPPQWQGTPTPINLSS